MKYLLSLFLAFISLSSQAHEYYFAFAEVAYNIEAKRFEGTIVVTTHDLEQVLEKTGDSSDNVPLETLTLTDEKFIAVNSELHQGFKLKIGGVEIQYNIVGLEVFLTGITNFYFESQVVEQPKTLDLYFTLMMDDYSEQQNKVELKIGERKEYFHFFGENRKQTFNIETSEN